MSCNHDCAVLEARPAPELPSTDPGAEASAPFAVPAMAAPLPPADPAAAAPLPPVGAPDYAALRALYAVVYSRVGNREAAETITSAVAPPAMDHSLSEQSTVSARRSQERLSRLAGAAVSDYWRGGHGTPTSLTIAAPETPPARMPLLGLAGGERARDDARTLLGLLPDSYRTVLSYRVVQGMSVTEAARRMAVSEDAVKALQYRALAYAADLRGAVKRGSAPHGTAPGQPG